MPRFTDEQMLEICRTREYLAAYKDKTQPYPELPEDCLPEVKPILQPSPKELRDSVHNLKVLTSDFETRLNQHIDIAKRKAQAKVKTASYKGLKKG